MDKKQARNRSQVRVIQTLDGRRTYVKESKPGEVLHIVLSSKRAHLTNANH
jgi:hypothetical protein